MTLTDSELIATFQRADRDRVHAAVAALPTEITCGLLHVAVRDGYPSERVAFTSPSFPGLAVTAVPHGYERTVWSISHIATGLSLPLTLGILEAVLVQAVAVASLVDWTAITNLNDWHAVTADEKAALGRNIRAAGYAAEELFAEELCLDCGGAK
jgi:hypothetical protein